MKLRNLDQLGWLAPRDGEYHYWSQWMLAYLEACIEQCRHEKPCWLRVYR